MTSHRSKTLGILAHVDAGKTTLSEQILYQSGAIRSCGRVDHQDAFLDIHSIEKEHGITVFSDQAVFTLQGRCWFLVDTPGHVDFSGEMERSLKILDYSVLVISCVEGIQSHTETIWKLLEQNHVPVLLFLNKIDRPGANPEAVLAQICKHFTPYLLDCSQLNRGVCTDTLAETLAEMDDALLEHYLEQGYDPQLWLNFIRRAVTQRRLFPFFTGSALSGEGISAFLDTLALIAWDESAEDSCQLPFLGQVYKVRHDSQKNRLVFLKVHQGRLLPKESICYCREDTGLFVEEKVDSLRLYNGSRSQPVAQAAAGDLTAVTGLSGIHPGEWLGERIYFQEHWEEVHALQKESAACTTPLLSAKLLFPAAIAAKTMLGYLRELEDEDPLLSVHWEETLREIHLHCMGVVQMEILQKLIQERFGVAVEFGDCEILYQETIGKPVMGYGHFEPLRHYAEVHLRLEPAPRGSGIVFSSECPLDQLDGNYQNAVRTHVLERQHRGILTGFPLTDLRVVLVNGRAHLKHTEGGDFREATYRAIRQGLEKADNLLLEPFCRYTIRAESAHVGRILTDLQRMKGSFQPPEASGDQVTITGRIPAATFVNYQQQLLAFTKGRANLSYSFDGYDLCHNSQDVIERIGYDKSRDVENTSDSVFCAKGAGFTVKWDEAEKYMHLL